VGVVAFVASFEAEPSVEWNTVGNFSADAWILFVFEALAVVAVAAPAVVGDVASYIEHHKGSAPSGRLADCSGMAVFVVRKSAGEEYLCPQTFRPSS